MDKGAAFVFKNFEKMKSFIEKNPQYAHLKNKVDTEFRRLKNITTTGNMFEHFSKFKNGKHPYANDFAFLSGTNILPNEEMADYLEANYKNELNNYVGINDLIVGSIYSNNDIVNCFLCSPQGGMRRSLKKNALVLTANHHEPLYDDYWDANGILNYTGTGKYGDQFATEGHNKTLAESGTNKVDIYLFESFKANEYYYCGKVELAEKPFFVNENDASGVSRKVVKFPLKRLDGQPVYYVKDTDLLEAEKAKAKAPRKDFDREVVKAKAKAASGAARHERETITTYIYRDPYIAEFTKLRAKGHCDLCGNEAPFRSGSKPYLECHHLITLAEGGPDAIYNTVALCPNCHRKIHVLNSSSDKKKLHAKIRVYLESDSDSVSLAKLDEIT